MTNEPATSKPTTLLQDIVSDALDTLAASKSVSEECIAGLRDLEKNGGLTSSPQELNKVLTAAPPIK